MNLSFVSIVSTEKFISVMSDGLVTNISPNKDVIRLEEDYQKFIRISPKQFIAFTGSKDIFEQIKNETPYKTERYDLKELANIFYKKSRAVPENEGRVMIGVGGIGQDDCIEFYTLTNSQEDLLKSFKPINDEISYAFLESSYIDEKKHSEINIEFIKLLKKNGVNTVNKILRTQKELNMFVEAFDPSVNKRTFELYIKKS
jgi:hypothetical protein